MRLLLAGTFDMAIEEINDAGGLSGLGGAKIVPVYANSTSVAAWSIAGGQGEMLLLGIISFFGVGAYVNAILFTKYGISPWINLFLGFLVAAALGRLIAALTLRFGLSEDYFAMFTVGISQLLKHLMLNWNYGGGATGIYITIIHNDFWMMSFVSRKPYLLVGLGILLLIRVHVEPYPQNENL